MQVFLFSNGQTRRGPTLPQLTPTLGWWRVFLSVASVSPACHLLPSLSWLSECFPFTACGVDDEHSQEKPPEKRKPSKRNLHRARTLTVPCVRCTTIIIFSSIESLGLLSNCHSCSLSLWAPGALSVAVDIGGAASTPMDDTAFGLSLWVVWFVFLYALYLPSGLAGKNTNPIIIVRIISDHYIDYYYDYIYGRYCCRILSCLCSSNIVNC